MQTASTGRVVVLTGANAGIGLGMLETLLADGYRVAALDVDTSNLDALGERYGQQLRVYECDVTSDADVDATIADIRDAWEHVDVLVNNAAVFEFGLVRDRTLADTRAEFEVNVFGPLRLVHAVLPHMREHGEGKVHLVSSGVGRVGNPGLSGYGATKGALEAYARSLRLELQREDVSCTVMHPALARKIESTKPVVYADWKTRLGLRFAELFPWLVKRGTRRFLDDPPTSSGATGTAAVTAASDDASSEDETGHRSAGDDASVTDA